MLCERGRRVDFVKVLDFGLVREQETGADLSREQVVRGTPLYMAPESITAPSEVDARADIYAVGGVAYYLLTGHAPFEGRSAIEVMAAQVSDFPEPPSLRARRTLPAGLEQLVMGCLEKLPARRPASMDDLVAAIDGLQGLESWTDAAARAWWQEHAQRLRSDGKSAGAPLRPSAYGRD
jgi:serine/threonine-protein kinase